MAVDYHRHCQATVLSASGISQANGATWSTLSELVPSLTDLPNNWINYYLNNTANITGDFAATLKVINDSNATNVHKSGDETIGGRKTFNKGLKHNRKTDDLQAINTLKITDFDFLTDIYPTISFLRVFDKNDRELVREHYSDGNGNINKVCREVRCYTNAGQHSRTLFTDTLTWNEATGKFDAELVYSVTDDGENTTTNNKNVTYPTPSLTSNSLATKGWVNNPETSTNVVHRTGAETIGGNKTFSNKIHISSTGDASCREPNPPLMIGSKTSYHLEIDNNEILARTGDGTTSETFGKTHDDTGTYASLGRHLGDLTLQGKNIYLNAWGSDLDTDPLENGEYPQNGNVFLQHSPLSTANGRQVVDAAWVNSNCVKLSGNQTITGQKTFSAAQGFNYSGIEVGTTNSSRNVWFSRAGDDNRGTPVYDDNFKYNPHSHTLSVNKIDSGVLLTSSPDPSATGHQVVDAAWVRSVIQTNNAGVVTQYVSSSGDDDANDGKSPSAARRTIRKAMEVLNGYRICSATGLSISLKFCPETYDVHYAGHVTIAHADAVNQNNLVIGADDSTVIDNNTDKFYIPTKIITSADLSNNSWYSMLKPIASNISLRNIHFAGFTNKSSVSNTGLVCMNNPYVKLYMSNVAFGNGFTALFNEELEPGRIQASKYIAFSSATSSLSTPIVYRVSDNSPLNLDGNIEEMQQMLRGKIVFKNIGSSWETKIQWHRGTPYVGKKWRTDIILDHVTCNLGERPGWARTSITNGSEYHAYIYCKDTDIETVFTGLTTDGDAYNHVISVSNDSQFPSWYDPNWDSVPTS